VNEKDADRDVVDVVTVPRLVSGGVASTVHVRIAGIASTKLPFLARTRNECVPSDSEPTVIEPDVPVPHGENAPKSTEHSNWRPATVEYAKVGVLELESDDSAGPDVIAVSTIVTERCRVVLPCPDASNACAEKVWVPSGSAP
jgi:hypothetical protein